MVLPAGQRCAAAVRSSTRSLLQPLLDEQDGVLTSAQLAALGVDPELPARQGWVRVAPRTWCTTGPPSDEQLLQALRQHTGAAGVPSGALACRRHGLRDVPERSSADVLVGHGRRLASGGLVVVHQSLLVPAAVRRRGWHVAPAARAVADAARWSADLRAARALVLAALDDRLVSLDHLVAEQDRGQRRGSAVLAQALLDWQAGARSAPEAEVADALRPERLPSLLLNPSVFWRGRLLGRPDGYLPGLALGYEVDSLRHHGGAHELAATLDRHAAFSAAGVELVHVVPTLFRRDPRRWAHGFAARARQRSIGGVGEPSGLEVVTHDALPAGRIPA